MSHQPRAVAYDASVTERHRTDVERRAPRSVRWASLLASAVVGAFLAATAFAGSYVRPIADDWCIALWARDGGLRGIVEHMYVHVNGRAANAAVNGLVFSPGLVGPKILPAALALALVVGVYLLLRLGGRLLQVTVPRSGALVAATTTAVLVLMSGRVVYQVYYWAPGSISHTLPPVIGVWALVLVAWAQLSRRRGAVVGAMALLALGGFVIGSLSEAFVMVSGVYAAAAVAWIVGRRAPRRLLGYPVAWLAGLVAGFALLYLSPGRRDRQKNPIDQAPLLSGEGVLDVLRQWAETWHVLLTQPLHLLALAAGVLVGMSASVHRGRRARRSAVRGSLTAVGLVVLVVASSLGVSLALRMGYGPNGWHYERVWVNFLVFALLTAVVLGAMLGAWLRRALPAAGIAPVAVVAAASIVVGTVSLLPSMVSLNRDMAARSVTWDEQNSRLHRLAAQGRSEVGYTPYRVANMTEPFTYRVYDDDWVASCVEDYYRVDRIVPAPSWLRSEASAAYRGVPVP